MLNKKTNILELIKQKIYLLIKLLIKLKKMTNITCKTNNILWFIFLISLVMLYEKKMKKLDIKKNKIMIMFFTKNILKYFL